MIRLRTLAILATAVMAMALLAFGDRVDEGSFTIVRGPLLLDRGAGLSIAREAATEARIDVVQG